MSEKVTTEELTAVRDAKNKAVFATNTAEKSRALAQVAELEAQNLILSLYNKYGLKVGDDVIMENGDIVRKSASELEVEKENTEKTADKE
jgi:hypothetical protein